MDRPLAVHAGFGQQFCDARDPPAVGRGDRHGHDVVLRGPGPHRPVEIAPSSEGLLHEVLQKAGLALPSLMTN